MFDVLRRFLIPKCFNVIGYMFVLLYFVIGLVLTGITGNMKLKKEAIHCQFSKEMTGIHMKFFEAECFSQYQEKFNSPLPLYAFVLITFGGVVVSCVAYSFGLKSRVEQVETLASDDITMLESTREAANTVQYPPIQHRYSYGRCRVFSCYAAHLVFRVLWGIVFTALQYQVFYPSGFKSDFICGFNQQKSTPSDNISDYTSSDCHNSSASEKTFCSKAVMCINALFAFLALAELIYLLQQFYKHRLYFAADYFFCRIYIFRKNSQSRPKTWEEVANCARVIDAYKKHILNDSFRPRTKTAKSVCDLSAFTANAMVFVVLLTRMYDFAAAKNLTRELTIRELEKLRDTSSFTVQNLTALFLPNPNADTPNEAAPRTIVLFGLRDSIIVFTKALLHEWVKDSQTFLSQRIIISVKIESFVGEENKTTKMTLKDCLRRATNLGNQEFEMFFQLVVEHPCKVVLVFEELNSMGNDSDLFMTEELTLNGINEEMVFNVLYLKLVCGKLLPGATIFTTAVLGQTPDLYKQLKFDREVLLTTYINIEKDSKSPQESRVQV